MKSSIHACGNRLLRVVVVSLPHVYFFTHNIICFFSNKNTNIVLNNVPIATNLL